VNLIDNLTPLALTCLASPAFVITVVSMGVVLGVLLALLMSAWAARPEMPPPHEALEAGDTHASFDDWEPHATPAPRITKPAAQVIRKVRAGPPQLKPSFDGRRQSCRAASIPATTSNPQEN